MASNAILITWLAIIFAAVTTNATSSVTPDCEWLPAPDNGGVQTVYSVNGGILAVFTCNAGYAALGATVLSCAHGKWSDTPPNCASVSHCNLQSRVIRPDPVDDTILKCGKLSGPRFGKLDIKIGSDGRSEIATFSCVPGYYVSGPSAMHCVEGNWDGKEPECLPVDCGAPEAPAHGTVEYNETTYTERAYYSCNDCHELAGYDERVCKRSGLWSKKTPQCVIRKDTVRCALPDIPGGSFIPGKNSLTTNGVACGEDLTIRCFSGRRLVGASTAICNPDGSYTWQGQRPYCRRLRWTR